MANSSTHACTHARTHTHARTCARNARVCKHRFHRERPMRRAPFRRPTNAQPNRWPRADLTADSISEAVRLSSRHRRSRAARARRSVHHISSLTVEIRRIGTMHAMNVMRARLTAACLRASHACRDAALDRAEARTFNITVATLFCGDDVPPHIRPHERGARTTRERIHDGGLG